MFSFARFLPVPVVIGVPDLLLPGDVEPPPDAFERLAVVSHGDFALPAFAYSTTKIAEKSCRGKPNDHKLEHTALGARVVAGAGLALFVGVALGLDVRALRLASARGAPLTLEPCTESP